jgi:hypothetical protein
MPRPSSQNLPPPDISSELKAGLLGLLPFGEDKTGLLSRGVGRGSPYKQRISYHQAERLRAGVVSELRPHIFSKVVPPSSPLEKEYVLYNARPPVPISTRYSEGLQVAAKALADGSLQGRLVSGVLAIAARLSRSWEYDPNRCAILDSGILLEKASVVHGLVHAVALLESNVSPDAQGFKHDISLKGWGAEYVAESAANELKVACEVVDRNPTIFGDRATTAGLLNAVAHRLQEHRPMVDGQPVGHYLF